MIKQFFLAGLFLLSGSFFLGGCGKNSLHNSNPSKQVTQTPQVTPSTQATQAPQVTPTPQEADTYFSTSRITADIFSRMKGKSYPDNCTLDLETLRYVTVGYINFDGILCKGELIVNTEIAEDVVSIFEELLKEEYPIESITLIDEYDADDNRSMAANNSSAFCYRVISGTDRLSNHSFGLAIDINPLYNPYIKSNGQVLPKEAEVFANRTITNPYYIISEDICVRIFKKYGFTWGGDWNTSKDYQHFEKRID